MTLCRLLFQERGWGMWSTWVARYLVQPDLLQQYIPERVRWAMQQYWTSMLEWNLQPPSRLAAQWNKTTQESEWWVLQVSVQVNAMWDSCFMVISCRYEVLDRSDSMTDNGYIKWDITLCFLLAWVLCFLCLIKGIKSSGKVKLPLEIGI